MSVGGPSPEATGGRGRRSAPMWVSGVAAWFVASLIGVTLTISLAALVFSGELVSYRGEAIGLALLGGTLLGVVVALRSSVPGMVATVQDATGAILAVAAASTIAAAPDAIEGAARFSTVTVANGLTAFVVAGTLFAFGRFGFGRFVRFLPHPVVGGFLAGTGWLLIVGGLAVMTDVAVGGSALGVLARPALAPLWMPGLGLAIVLFSLTRGGSGPWVWPSVLMGSVALFYLAMVQLGGTPSSWRELGLLMGPFPDADPLRPFAAIDLAVVHWPSVARYVPTAGAVALLAALGVLLNTTALELVTGRNADLDRELRLAGMGNAATGLVGGLVGYHMLSDTVLLHRIGRGSRLEAFGVAASSGLAFAFGAALIAFVPTFLLGGLLAYLGLSFLHEWLWESWKTLSRLEYALVVLILAVIAVFGFLPGLGVGLGAALLVFVLEYSRTAVVARELDGTVARSRVVRGARASDALHRHGMAIRVLDLRGYLFFGTANTVFERVRSIADSDANVRFVVLDARHVTGIDATALMVIDKLLALAQRRGVDVVFSGLSPSLERLLASRNRTASSAGRAMAFATLDTALEWCEDRLLEALDDVPAYEDFEAWLAERWRGPGDPSAVLAYFERNPLQAGDVLVRAGDASDALWFVASGSVTAQLERDGAPPLRFETMKGGSLVGELGFFTGEPRSATVVAEEPGEAYRLTAAAHERMLRADPAVAGAFHGIVLGLMADRTRHLMKVVAALQR